jgi:hypothetical protein
MGHHREREKRKIIFKRQRVWWKKIQFVVKRIQYVSPKARDELADANKLFCGLAIFINQSH